MQTPVLRYDCLYPGNERFAIREHFGITFLKCGKCFGGGFIKLTYDGEKCHNCGHPFPNAGEVANAGESLKNLMRQELGPYLFPIIWEHLMSE